jgi:hypothetical protein
MAKVKRGYLGMDVGAKGGAVLVIDSKIVAKHPFDLDGSFNITSLARFIFDIRKQIKKAYVEDVRSLFAMSAKSNFSFGENKGILIGILEAYRIKYNMVYSKTWQKVAWKGVEIICDKKGKNDTKATSLDAFKNIFGDIDMRKNQRCRVQHDGLVDAALIGYYGECNECKKS